MRWLPDEGTTYWRKELARFHQAIIRKLESFAGQLPKSVSKQFNDYTKRFFKDMESKGTIRTVVESMNLAEYADHPDPLMAECPRTFPSVTFPAGTFLKRSEIVTGVLKNNTVNRPLRHGHGNTGQAHTNEPADLLYGYRGRAYNVDLHSPFEMLRFWKPVRITAWYGSTLTNAGKAFKEKCRTP